MVDAAGAEELGDDVLDRVRRHREADADVAGADAAVSICVFTPITCPCMLSSGPPEFPWLIGASVWMTWSIANLLGAWICALETADDAEGDRPVEPERVPDRDDLVADAHAVGVRRAGAA